MWVLFYFILLPLQDHALEGCTELLCAMITSMDPLKKYGKLAPQSVMLVIKMLPNHLILAHDLSTCHFFYVTFSIVYSIGFSQTFFSSFGEDLNLTVCF